MKTARAWLGILGSGVLVSAVAVAAPSAATAGEGHETNRYLQQNLVSDQPGHAMSVDPNLVNA